MRKIKIFLVIALFFLPVICTGVSVTGFYGFGGGANGQPCNTCHNEPGASHFNGTYPSGILLLDGIDKEAFWTSTYGRRMEIPVGNKFGATEQFIKMVFAQNTTHLFILMDWEDATINGTDSATGVPSDGFSICFGVNTVDFRADYFSGMASPKPGEYVDTIIWKPIANETGLQTLGPNQNKTVDGTLYDKYLSNAGWGNDATNEWAIAIRHGNFSTRAPGNYHIELVRPLVTAETNYDVQFSHSAQYQFAIAILNASSGINHYMSYEHALYVYNPSGDTTPPIPGFELLLILLPAVFLVSIVLLRKNRKI